MLAPPTAIPNSSGKLKCPVLVVNLSVIAPAGWETAGLELACATLPPLPPECWGYTRPDGPPNPAMCPSLHCPILVENDQPETTLAHLKQ